MSRLRTEIVSPLILLLLISGTVFAEGPARKIDFTRDIRPILSEYCYACHGPDSNKREADLRLDTQEGLFKKLDEHSVVLPGKAGKSDLYIRLITDDADLRMPPADSERTLKPEQIALIKRWIDAGADWQGHWAFVVPKRPAIPNVKKKPTVKNDIDRFVLAALNVRGLKQSSQTDRVTLIRRLSFDLQGLPPTPQEVNAFVNDKRSDAYEKLVDRMLSSPRYGERMAQYWLDLVRYADTNGIHGDNHREVALYRDYVINAFNDNKPFDEFTREQLAGDLLPGSTWEQKIASGYNRLLMTTREGGAQPREYLAKYASDRVRNLGTVWLGSTLGCSECHDHKYDPYTMKDFYSLAAFFADIKETAVGTQPPTRIPSAAQEQQVQQLDQQIAVVRKTLDTQTPELDTALAKWEQAERTKKIEWTALKPVEAKSKNGAILKVLEDGSVIASGKNPDTDEYTLSFNNELKGVTGLRLEALPDDSFPAKGPGRAGNGNFVVNELILNVSGKPVKFSQATATHSQNDWNIKGAIDGNPKTGWAILNQAGRPNSAVFEAEADLSNAKDSIFTIVFQQNHVNQHTLGKFRLLVTNSSRPVRADGRSGLPEQIAAILKLEADKRNAQQKQQLAAHYRTIAPALEPARKQMADLEAQKKKIQNAMPTMLVSTAVKPRIMRVLPRGNWLDDSGEVVQPAVPEFLPGLKAQTQRANRLDLANWLVDAENPIVARVFVNRLWKLMFGRGLVKTLDDFGSQGELPSHPELLNWLSVEFTSSGWDVKRMMKLIALSGTYRQSSASNEEQRKQDPFNRLLARQGRFRLDAEMVRDNALTVSGLLVHKDGGSSTKPYQPTGYWAHLNFPKRVYKHDTGENQYRRGLYTYWCRTFLHPSMLAFDAPTREECTVDRPRSNTPLQALVLLNDPTYVEASRALAKRILQEGGKTTEERIQFAYRLILTRKADANEVKILSGLLEKHRGEYQKTPQEARDLLAIGLTQAPEEIDAVELAAWTSLTRVILNLHETITRF